MVLAKFILIDIKLFLDNYVEESCVSVIMSAKKEESLTETIMNYCVKENPDNIIG